MSSRAIRILFFVPGLAMGGAERHTVELRSALDACGFETHLLVFGRRRSPTILEHPGARDAVLLDLRGMSSVTGWRRVRSAIGGIAPDIIVAVNQTPLIVSAVMRACGVTHAKIMCIFHSTTLRANEARRVVLFRWAARVADALVFVSQTQKTYWSARGLTGKRMPVILNGIDMQRFDGQGLGRPAVRAALGCGDGDLAVGLVATFRPEKDHPTFLRAIARLRRRGDIVKAVLVGDGPTRPACERLVEELGIQDDVVFVGEQADVRPYMAACDVGVLCSTHVETFSLAAIEFLALGVPMLMSRIGGATEIVSEGVNGHLFGPGEVEELATHLHALAEPIVRRRLASSARASVAHLTTERMVSHYVDLLRILVARTDGVAEPRDCYAAGRR